MDYLITQALDFEGSVRDLPVETVKAWLWAARNRLEIIGENEMRKLADYASTILLAILEADAGLFIQIGDGAWVVETASGIEAATWPDVGQYANETTFLTSSDFEEHLQPALIQNPLRIAGFTDGLQSLCLNFKSGTPQVPLLEKLFSRLTSLEECECIPKRLLPSLSQIL